MQKKEYNFIVLITFLLLGLLIAVQFRSTLYINNQKSQNMMDAEKLVGRLNREKATESELRRKIEIALAQKEDIEKLFLEEKEDTVLAFERESVRLKAGLADVKGPGIEIKLDDAPAKMGGDPRKLIIHDQDIKIIINELKSAGAQAISINGERISAISEQICAGPTILINKNRYPVPYTINAIGNIDKLYTSMIESERINIMIQDKIRIEIKKSSEVLVPRFNGELLNLISGLEEVKK